MNIAYNGDAIKLAKKTENEIVDLILTDIPYNISRKNQLHTMGRTGFDFQWDKNQFLVDSLYYILPLLKKGGSFITFSSFAQCGELDKLMAECGMLRKDKLIFVKKNPMPRNINRRYVADVEVINWFVKKGKKWTFNKPPETPYLRSILEHPVATHNSKYHPTSKPIGLLKQLIEVHSNKKDLIFDPFGGSMTTAVAAYELNRSFLICEKNQGNFLKGKEFLKKHRVKFTDGGSR